MNNFKTWLENYESLNRYKPLVLAALGLNNSGSSQLVNNYKQEELIQKLSGLGEFTSLPADKKNRVIGCIRAGIGTIGDLINIMSINSYCELVQI